MGTYIIRRILQMLLILLLVTLIVFFMVRLLPGDPILMFLSSQDLEKITQEQLDFLKHDLGLDRPMIVQYFEWLGDVARGDPGKYIIPRRDIVDDVKTRLPITFQIGALSFIVSIVIGIPIGVIAAIKRGTWVDNLLTSVGNLGICTPNFWLGILLIYLVGYKAGWLPIFGYVSPFDDPWGNIQHIILPVFVLGTAPIASGLRLTRSSMLEVLRQDYIRTAWSKGLKQQTIIIRHGLKNGLIPVITLKGMTLAANVGGSGIV